MRTRLSVRQDIGRTHKKKIINYGLYIYMVWIYIVYIAEIVVYDE